MRASFQQYQERTKIFPIIFIFIELIEFSVKEIVGYSNNFSIIRSKHYEANWVHATTHQGAFQGYQEHGEKHGDLGDLNMTNKQNRQNKKKLSSLMNRQGK